ncbi:GntR family transcriptional regulator [Dactylosporangium sucinum]|uniref:GntR family transcriptional regulator n=2 Tax=Dactylosporangium sucinum TaxID=1424081 RepID=A0A917TFP1_9ACTN|nr:GntR family transcriptional regulator [Dactylosporangium sucinum]
MHPMMSPPANGGHRPQKAAMLLAQRIIRDVQYERLKPGDHLEPERTMLERYETGRGTLREALRFLEFQGVIVIKPGPRGGPILTDPNASHLASTLVLLMQLKQAPFRNIVEVRTALEPMISRLAAERISDESLAELGGTIDQMRDHLDNQDLFLEANQRFHDIIAWSSGNTLFGYIVDSLLGILDGTVIGIEYPSPRRAAIVKAHDEIYHALMSRDPQAAEDRMRDHINEYVKYAELKFPEVMDHVIRWDRTIT